jgi:quinol monooxygenase YgiN
MLILHTYIEAEEPHDDPIRDELPDIIAASRAEDGCEVDRHVATPHMIR